MNRYGLRSSSHIVLLSRHDRDKSGTDRRANVDRHTTRGEEAHHAYLGLGLRSVRLTHLRNTLAADGPTRPVGSRRRDRAIRIQRSNDDVTGKRLWLLIGLVDVSEQGFVGHTGSL